MSNKQLREEWAECRRIAESRAPTWAECVAGSATAIAFFTCVIVVAWIVCHHGGPRP